MILLPPGGRTAAVWPQPMLARLAETGLSVVLVDLPGQGRSEPGEGPLSMADVAEGVVELIDVLDPPAATRPQTHVAGVALGGTIALRVGLAGRAASVTVASTSAWYADPAMPGAEEPVVVSLVYRQERHTPALLRRSLERELRALSGPADPSALDPPRPGQADLDAWIAHGHRARDDHRGMWLGAENLWDAVAELPCPLTVVHGDADPLVPLAHGQRLASRVAGARLVVLPGAGHIVGPALSDAIVAAVAAHAERGEN